MTNPAKHISVSIKRPFDEVYDFFARPENMPKWASGLSTTLEKSGDLWISESPMGKVKVKFTEKNFFGVLDHDVTLPGGQVFHNPLRVMRNDKGSEVVFTLFRQPEVSDADFAKDAAHVAKDLNALKTILEAG